MENLMYCSEFCRDPEIKVSNICCMSCQKKDVCNNKCTKINCDLLIKQISEVKEV